ncbi:hypothetical protein HY251_01715 [bacterium]|nr:hypothetical protein [bacterium]
MGRVTFQDQAVIKRVEDGFVASWKNYANLYVGQKLEQKNVDDLLKSWQDGTASENISTLVSTPEGEILHEIPGFVKASEYVRELDFAIEAGRAVESAGTDPDARRRALASAHAKRLACMTYADRKAKLEPILKRAFAAYGEREKDAAAWKHARTDLARAGTVGLRVVLDATTDVTRAATAYSVLRALTGELIPDDSDSWKGYVESRETESLLPCTYSRERPSTDAKANAARKTSIEKATDRERRRREEELAETYSIDAMPDYADEDSELVDVTSIEAMRSDPIGGFRQGPQTVSLSNGSTLPLAYPRVPLTASRIASTVTTTRTVSRNFLTRPIMPVTQATQNVRAPSAPLSATAQAVGGVSQARPAAPATNPGNARTAPSRAPANGATQASAQGARPGQGAPNGQTGTFRGFATGGFGRGAPRGR